MDTGRYYHDEDQRLDTKLQFARVCSLIDELEFDEESFMVLKDLENEYKEIIRSRRSQDKLTNNNTLTSFAMTLNNATLVKEHQSNTDPYSSVRYGTILEEDEGALEFERDDDPLEDNDDSSILENTNIADDFILQNWTIKQIRGKLHLKGIKLDRRGKLIEKNFQSKEIISQQNGIVKTADGYITLRDGKVDQTKSIPLEIRKFCVNNQFPKNWKKVLQSWIKLEKEQAPTEAKQKSQNGSKKGKRGKS